MRLKVEGVGMGLGRDVYVNVNKELEKRTLKIEQEYGLSLILLETME